MSLHRLSLLLPIVLLACDGPPPPEPTAAVRGEAPAHTPPTARLKRLTEPQYRAIIRDVFSEDLLLPANLEPDERIEGLFAVGSATSAISSYGVEKYEAAAYDVAEQVLADPLLRDEWVPCDGTLPDDDACAAEALDTLGLHPIWILAVGPLFAALTGIGFKEFFCFRRPEAVGLTLLLPIALLGRLTGLVGTTSCMGLMLSAALLLLVLSMPTCPSTAQCGVFLAT